MPEFSDDRCVSEVLIFNPQALSPLARTVAKWDYNPRMAPPVNGSEQAQNIRLVVDTIPALAWSARPDGSAEFFNRRWLEYAGLCEEQAVDWGWTVAIHPDDLSRLVDYWQSVLASGEPGEIEARLRRFDGEYRWFLFRASPLRDESGKIVNWYGTNTDIDDRKEAEDAVRASEQSFRTMLDALKMILIGASLTEVLTSVTRLIEAHDEGMLCSIFLVDKDGQHLRYAAAPSLPESYRAATDGIAIGPNAQSCGTAAYPRQPVFTPDILSDPK